MEEETRADPRAVEVTRRELLAAGAAAGAALTLAEGRVPAASASAGEVIARLDFSRSAPGPGWGGGWDSVGVANLRRVAGEGLLEAGSDVFPNDPRPVAFPVDARFRDGSVSAAITRVGSASGVVIRRRSPRSYYAAIYEPAALAVRIVRRRGVELAELARVPVILPLPPLRLSLTATGSHPTTLRAELRDALGRTVSRQVRDGDEALQEAGDAGVLTTAETLFPSDRNPVLPALGNLHLLPWSVQEGQAVMRTEVGRQVIALIRRLSTAGFREIVIRSTEQARPTAPSVVAATTGAPVPGGARLQVATDAAADVSIELSYSPRFAGSWSLPLGETDDFLAAAGVVRGLVPGRRIHWRPRLRRGGRTVLGASRSFRVLPRPGSGAPVRIAVAACGSQFGQIFDHLATSRPDVFVWQGDLNYPDTHGPLAQTTSGYAGIWRDFLANPRLAPLLERTAFAAQRDDHDYAVQDANSTNIPDYPWGLEPWEALVNRRRFYRFPAGVAEVWVLDQRMEKSDPAIPDSPQKTLLGDRQRRWLLRTLAASNAPFKLICSPGTMFMRANQRDGNWSAGYTAERDLILDHIDREVTGTTLFLTGDTHLTGVYASDGRFEARAAPVGIPKPNDVTLLDPLAASDLRRRPGVAYASDECHFTVLDAGRRAGEAVLDLRLVREDGATAFARSFRSPA